MSDYVTVGLAADFPEGELRQVQVGPDEVVIGRVQGKLYALSNYCTHAGAPLSEGYIEDCQLICAYHRWSFALDSGAEMYGGSPVNAYAVREIDGEVQVQPRDTSDGSRPPHLRFVSSL